MVATLDTGPVTETGLVVGIKKSKGLKGLVESHNAQPVDEVREVEVSGSGKLQYLLDYYTRFLEKDFDAKQLKGSDPKYHISEEFWDCFKFPKTEEKMFNVSSDEINLILQATVGYENHRNYATNTGLFISKLIEISYKKFGHNNFCLNLENLGEINYLASYLVGKEEDRLVIDVKGEAGKSLASRCKGLTLNVEGNVKNLGSNSENCTYNVIGNAISIGTHSQSCTFNVVGDIDDVGSMSNLILNVTGDVGEILYNSKSVVNIDGNVDKISGGYNSVFNVKGNVFDCGFDSKYCEFNVGGNVHNCGMSASGSKFNVKGNVNKFGWKQFNCELYCDGNIGSIEEGLNSTYRTSNRETLQSFIEQVTAKASQGFINSTGWGQDRPKRESRNRIIFVHENGDEKLVRDYNDTN